MPTTPRSDDSQAGKGGTPIPSGETAGPGHNVTKNNAEVREACASTFERMSAIEARRKQCNEELSAEREGLYARGLNKHAVRAAYAYWKMDPKQRDGFDDSLLIARSGIGLPIQSELWEEAEEPTGQGETGKSGSDNGTAAPPASGRRKKH